MEKNTDEENFKDRIKQAVQAHLNGTEAIKQQNFTFQGFGKYSFLDGQIYSSDDSCINHKSSSIDQGTGIIEVIVKDVMTILSEKLQKNKNAEQSNFKHKLKRYRNKAIHKCKFSTELASPRK